MTGEINNILDLPFYADDNFSVRNSHKIKKEDSVSTKTFKETAIAVRELTAGFAFYGIKPGDHIGFFVNNRFEWIITDFAIMALRAVSVPRGSDTVPHEVQFIFNHSDSSFLILENVAQLLSLRDAFSKEDWLKAEKIFIIDSGSLEDVDPVLAKKIVFYDTLIKYGQTEYKKNPDFIEKMRKEIISGDLLTIVYTSGTTGNPKGVMLTHGNFVQNVISNTPRLEIDAEKGETTVVMLPSWHVYERAFEYCAFFAGVTVVYSSPKNFAADLKEEKPEVLITVPRVWESIYQKLIKALSKMPVSKRYLIFTFIKINQIYLSSCTYLKGGYVSLRRRSAVKRGIVFIWNVILYFFTIPGHFLAHKMFKPFRASVGGRLRGAASAAGALPKYLDELFNSIGIKIVNAYGMTECAPGILSRTFGTNTFGTIGVPFDNVEVEIRRDDGSKTDIGENSIEHDKIYSILMKEVSSLISREHGFKSFERISKILAVRNNFSIGKELTQTMKVKRKYIVDKYQSLIEKLHRDTRN